MKKRFSRKLLTAVKFSDASELYMNFFSSKIILFFLLIATGNVYAQQKAPIFCVYDFHGNVVLQKTSSSIIDAIKKAQFINNGEVIIIKDDNSRIVLFDKDANYITLNAKGNYTTDAIQKHKKEHIKDAAIIAYSSFFWKDLLTQQAAANPDTTGDSDKLSILSRGLIQIISPSSNYQTSMDELLFKWKKIKIARAYSFMITDRDGKNYYHKIFADTSLLIHFKDSLPYGKRYRWSLGFVSNTVEEVEPFNGQLELVDEEKILSVLQLNSPYSLQGIVRGLQYAELYEENGCIKKAYATYKNLIEKNPDDKSLKALFISFKKHNYIFEN